MATVFQQCVECGSTYMKTIKKQFDFRIEDIPFRTKQKYERLQCEQCGEEFIAGYLAAQIDKEVATARAFLAEQDRQYSYQNSITDEIWMMPVEDRNKHTVPQPSKQWQRGFIHYLRMVNTGEKIIIVPTSTPYTIYCNEADKLATAARQFVKPDDYFKLTSIS